MATDDASVLTSHLIPVDHATRHPCPQCGARPWLQGVTSSQRVPCGYRDGPTPRERLVQRGGARLSTGSSVRAEQGRGADTAHRRGAGAMHLLT